MAEKLIPKLLCPYTLKDRKRHRRQAKIWQNAFNPCDHNSWFVGCWFI